MKVHGNRDMTFREEAAVVSHLFLTSLAVGSVKSRDALLATGTVLEGKKKSKTTPQAARNLMKRHEELLRKSHKKGASSERTRRDTVINTEEFITAHKEVQDRFQFPADLIVNVDETMLQKNNNSGFISYACATRTIGATKEKVSANEGCIIPFVSAAGTVWLLVIVIRMQGATKCHVIKPKSRSRYRNTPLSVLYLASASGFIDERGWTLALEAFIGVVKASPWAGKEVLLLCDNLASHKSVNSLNIMSKHQYQFLFFPPGCSQFIQPLDNAVFAIFKTTLTANLDTVQSARAKQGRRPLDFQQAIMSVLEATVEKAFQKTVIIRSFKATGIFPYNPDLIRQNARENVGFVPETAKSIDLDLMKRFAAMRQCNDDDIAAVTSPTKETRAIAKYKDGCSTIRLEEAQREAEAEAARVAEVQAQAARDREAEKAIRAAQNEANETAAKEARVLKKKLEKRNICKVKGCTRRWVDTFQNSGGWQWCNCDAYTVCHEHYKLEENRRMLQQHEDECQDKDDQAFLEKIEEMNAATATKTF